MTHTVFYFVELFILFTAISINSIYSLFTFISFVDIVKRKRNYTDSMLEKTLTTSFYRPISLLVPAFNESSTIISSLKSQLNIDYAEYEIIVINDGSTDNMMNILINEFQLMEIHRPIKLDIIHQPIRKTYISTQHPNLIVIDKENGGKFDAINCGINASLYPLFCVIDADSVLEKDSLLRVGAMFADNHHLVAAGGTVRPLNGCIVKNGVVQQISAPRTFIEVFQSVEYLRGFLLGRSAWNIFGSLLIISGAFGVFRKDIVKSIGGYRHTVGEDMDMVIRMHKYCIDNNVPYKILSMPDTICWTQVPDDWKSLSKQRNRWQRGLIDCLLHNRKMLFNPKYKSVGLFGLVYFLIVEAAGGVIEFLGYLALIIIVLFSDINLYYIIAITSMMFLWTNYITLGAIFFDNLLYRRYASIEDLTKLVAAGLVENFGYRQFLSYHRFLGSVTFWKRGWGHIKRTDIETKTAITDHSTALP